MGAPALLRGKQFGNADQVIGDQIEQEVGGDASNATMFGLVRVSRDREHGFQRIVSNDFRGS